MCGIAANYGDVDRAAGERMLERLAHRGPDDTGSVTVSDRAWLGHTRLSIVDVEGGQQPLSTEEPEMWLVGNGEIYNHEDVRQTFDGRIFSTRSDNEVALHLISERGVRAIDELSGMYAFLARAPTVASSRHATRSASSRCTGRVAGTTSGSPRRCVPSTPNGCRWSSSSHPVTTGPPTRGSCASSTRCPPAR